MPRTPIMVPFRLGDANNAVTLSTPDLLGIPLWVGIPRARRPWFLLGGWANQRKCDLVSRLRPLLLVAAATCPVFPPALACLVQARTHAPRPNLLWIEEEKNDTRQYFIISLGTSSIDGSGETIDS